MVGTLADLLITVSETQESTAAYSSGFLGCSRALGDFRFKAPAKSGPEDILDKLHSQEDAALLPEQQKAMPCIPRYFVELDVFRVCFVCVTWQNCLWLFTGTS